MAQDTSAAALVAPVVLHAWFLQNPIHISGSTVWFPYGRRGVHPFDVVLSYEFIVTSFPGFVNPSADLLICITPLEEGDAACAAKKFLDGFGQLLPVILSGHWAVKETQAEKTGAANAMALPLVLITFS